LTAIRNALTSGDYQVVIMEEGNVAAVCGLFPVEEMLEIMTLKPADVELVITGRRRRPARGGPGRSGDGDEGGQALLPGRGGSQGWD
jgi:hypothetical protein